MGVKVLSLFDGMSCGAVAFRKMGVEVDRYVAYEIDEYALKVSAHNFPDIEQRGNVFGADFTEFDGFDYIVGGSPCTYWSITQKNNRETKASGLGWELFSQYARAVKEAKPKFFLYENNKSMSKEIRASITETFGFEPILINSALVSAQNRQRLYWVGIRQADGTYRKADIEQPEDKGILLRDVLDNAVAWREKSYCIDANYYKGGNLTSFTKQSGTRFMAAEPVNAYENKSHTLKAQYFKNGVANFVTNGGFAATAVAEPVNVTTDGKSTTICGQGGGVGAKTGLYAIPVEFADGIPVKAMSVADGKFYQVYRVSDGLITIKDKQYPIKLVDGYYIIRKLTVSECKRLQTVPDWYDFSVISNSQAYKCLGNGWTVDVIAHILKSLQ